MIKVVKGDLLNETNGILVHGLSARLVMASGIAESIRQMYPVVYMDYNLHCRNLLCSPKVLDYDDPNKILLGEVILSEIAEDFYILSGITQLDYGRNRKIQYVNYDALRKVFQKASDIALTKCLPLKFPMIGAGLGNGKWEEIVKIIEDAVHPEVEKILFVK